MVSGGRMVEMGMDTAYAVIFRSKFKYNHVYIYMIQSFKHVCLKKYMYICMLGKLRL